MQIANTKQVRSIVRSLNVAAKSTISYTSTWTNKCAQKNMRNLAFVINKRNADATLQAVNNPLFLAGFTNTAKVTHAEYVSYLRIKAAFVA